MAETIIFLAISSIVSIVFIILGIHQYRSDTPVALNTGEKPPRKDELIDMAEWNHKHGRNLIIYGCLLFLTLLAAKYSLIIFDSVMLQMIVFFAAIIGEIAWLEIRHIRLKKKLIKNQ